MVKPPQVIRLKGFRDTLPEDWEYYGHILNVCEEEVLFAGFERIDIPTLERNELYERSVGEETDIVSKEMYTFDASKLGKEKGKKKREVKMVSLRPELTAGVVRSFIENGMHTLPKPISFYVTGKCFRHENPQAGRYREFTQFGVEVFGEEDPTIDASVIMTLWGIFIKLGFKNLRLDVNSIGCRECRNKMKKMLLDFFKKKQSKVCDDCKKRMKKNPFRILDCKNEKCQSLVASAPPTIDIICEECKEHFMSVLELLDDMDVKYNLTPNLVRGLDYYNRTVFEITTNDEKRQSSLGGGGRYDYLIEDLGGESTPAIGFGIGVDRVANYMMENSIRIPKSKSRIDVYAIHLGKDAKKIVLKVIKDLRELGVSVGLAVGKDSIRAQLKAANKISALFSVIIGQKEAVTGVAMIRDMRDGVQETVEMDDLLPKVYKIVEERKKEEKEEYGKKIKAKMDKQRS